MNIPDVVAAQLDFYRRSKAGCLFAAVAAVDPKKYHWTQTVIPQASAWIDGAIREAIACPETTMFSLIFPDVTSIDGLLALIRTLQTCGHLWLEQNVVLDEFHCLGFRARVGSANSWVTGFGPFDFLPVTRQAPFSEIALRVKPRPHYARVMKKAPDNVIHLADLDMLGMADDTFKKLWHGSRARTAELLGHRPDLWSAAKTTFAVPLALTKGIDEPWVKRSH